MDQIKNVLSYLRGSLWLVPAAMSAMAVGLGYLLMFAGIELGELNGARRWWLFGGDAETARNLLSSLLTGMITMTSLVVSITMVVLSLAAGQLGPRLIGNFMRDRAIQGVLGLFVGTILYILFVLRSITGELSDDLPHLPISIGYALSVLCLFALLFYVHKIARSIIADTVVREVAAELEAAIAAGRGRPREADSDGGDVIGYARREVVSLGKAGYVQVVDVERLTQLAAETDALFELNIRAGDFVLRGGMHVAVLSNTPLPDDLPDKICKAVVIGGERTPTQDLEFSIRQLDEVALRALSSGINDTFTAIAVIDRLAAALESASRNADPPSYCRDEAGRVRLRLQMHSFADLLDTAFDRIRHAGNDNPAVLIRLAAAIGQLAAVVEHPAHREALRSHLDRLERAVAKHVDEPADVDSFAAAAGEARQRLAQQPSAQSNG